jgi:SAM-dependent methyltransferase
MARDPASDAWADDVRARSREQWGRDPAGGLAADEGTLGTPEGFARVERYRLLEQPWMHDVFHWERLRGLDVLELGVGLGTDHVWMGRAGARLSGVDLTPSCVALASERMRQEGLESDLRVMDAEHLDYADTSFDVVYSFGVLHHVPHPEHAFAEACRVLRPAGHFIGGLYNRHSAWYARLRLLRVVRRESRHETLEQRHARIEYSTGDHHAHVRLFSARELRSLLLAAGFRHVSITRRHAGIPLRGHPRMRGTVDATIGRAAGWYLIFDATR